jgi:hypothetical protein
MLRLDNTKHELGELGNSSLFDLLFLFLEKVLSVVVGPEATDVYKHAGDSSTLLARKEICECDPERISWFHHVPDFIPYIFDAKLIVPTLNPFLVYISVNNDTIA